MIVSLYILCFLFCCFDYHNSSVFGFVVGSFPDHRLATTTTTTTTTTCLHSSKNEQPLRRRDVLAFLLTTTTATIATQPAHAAPPIAIIAEELGYYPVTNRAGDTVYIPQAVQRTSSAQAVELAKTLHQQGVVMVGTYWCPHTSRQKELFGKEAWSRVEYVECSQTGYRGNPAYCIEKQVDGYPAWIFPNGKIISGERPLAVLAREIGFTEFRDELELNLPQQGGASCKLNKN